MLKAVEEHHVAGTLMGEIKELAAWDEAFGAKVAVLIDTVRRRNGGEERHMFTPGAHGVPG